MNISRPRLSVETPHAPALEPERRRRGSVRAAIGAAVVAGDSFGVGDFSGGGRSTPENSFSGVGRSRASTGARAGAYVAAGGALGGSAELVGRLFVVVGTCVGGARATPTKGAGAGGIEGGVARPKTANVARTSVGFIVVRLLIGVSVSFRAHFA